MILFRWVYFSFVTCQRNQSHLLHISATWCYHMSPPPLCCTIMLALWLMWGIVGCGAFKNMFSTVLHRIDKLLGGYWVSTYPLPTKGLSAATLTAAFSSEGAAALWTWARSTGVCVHQQLNSLMTHIHVQIQPTIFTASNILFFLLSLLTFTGQSCRLNTDCCHIKGKVNLQ